MILGKSNFNMSYIEEEILGKTEWYNSFAWLPVHVTTGEWVWLERIQKTTIQENYTFPEYYINDIYPSDIYSKSFYRRSK